MLKRDFDVKYLSLTGNLEPVLRAETGLVGVVAASTLTECRVLGDGRCWSIVDRVWSIIGGADARPDGVVVVLPSEHASISCSNLTRSGNGPV